MTDTSGVSADSGSAPELPLVAPNPISTESEGLPAADAKAEGQPLKTEKSEPAPKKSVSIDEALDKAFTKVESLKGADPKTAKPAVAEKPAPVAVKTEPVRDETGKFAAKEGEKPVAAEKPAEIKPSYTAGDPPSRFSPDAKKEWATAPEAVRAEVSRMERELTAGFEKHRTAAERDASLSEFHDMAAKGGTDVKTALSKYVGMENQLKADLPKGLDIICQQAGTSLREVAAHILGQTPDQNQTAQDATIRELRQELSAVKQQVGTVSQTFEQQRTDAAMRDVTKFAQDNPRFEELSEDIALFMKTGRAKDLPEAYGLAERLNPAQVMASKPQVASSAPVIDLAAQTARGQKSITGSPSAGSTPANRKPSSSIDEALDRALAQVG